MLTILDLLGGRGCLAPEDICNVGTVCTEWRTFAISEGVWLVLSRAIHLRPLPAALAEVESEEGWAKESQAGTAKGQLLQEYVQNFAVRQRVRQLCRRMKGFWLLWAPEVAAALRGGSGEAALRRVESDVGGELPEDLAEFFRWCDGYEREAFWFAEAAPGGALAFRVARLLPLSEMAGWKPGAGWLPVARCREGGMTCCRILPKAEEAVGFYGELWCSSASGRVERSGFTEGTPTRQSPCFLDYLQDYVSLLEGLPAQWAEQQLLTTQSLTGALTQLFSAPRIFCDEQGSWMTTGLGKGKGNLWQRLDRSQPVRVLFPPSLGKTGKRRASFAQSWLLGK